MDNKINLLLGFDLERARAAAGVERTYLARALTRGRRKVVANTIYGWERLGKTPTKAVIDSLKKLFDGAEEDFPVPATKKFVRLNLESLSGKVT